MMTRDEIEELAEKENKDGSRVLAAILYTYLGAVEEGRERELLDLTAKFSKESIDRLSGKL